MDIKRGKIDMSKHKPKQVLPVSDVNQKADKPAVPSNYMLDWVEKNHPQKAHFTIAEAATIIGMSADFIRDHINDGNIMAVNMGSQKRITIIELARILEQGVN